MQNTENKDSDGCEMCGEDQRLPDAAYYSAGVIMAGLFFFGLWALGSWLF